MKEKELREAATCDLCKRQVMAFGMPLFLRVTVTRYGIKADPVRRQTGLAMVMGNALLANAMGPNEDMAEIISERTITACETCAQKSENHLLYQILCGEED